MAAPGRNMHHHRMPAAAEKLCQCGALKALQIVKGVSQQYNFYVKTLKAKDPRTRCQEGSELAGLVQLDSTNPLFICSLGLSCSDSLAVNIVINNITMLISALLLL